MRIISQKGMPVMTDIPYEKVVISQSMIEPNKIVAWDFFGGEDTIILMAEYSTPEKAEKVMQKLHECHIGIHAVGGLDDTVDCSSLSQIGIYKINENGDYAYKLPAGERIFRFPQDDEL